MKRRKRQITSQGDRIGIAGSGIEPIARTSDILPPCASSCVVPTWEPLTVTARNTIQRHQGQTDCVLQATDINDRDGIPLQRPILVGNAAPYVRLTWRA